MTKNLTLALLASLLVSSVAIAQPTTRDHRTPAPAPPPPRPDPRPIAPPVPPPPPPVVRWDPTGWTLLGQRAVTGRRDRDRIVVGKYQGQFDEVMVVVEDNDIELMNMTITFGNGKKFRPVVRHYFRESSRTRAIDLPMQNRMIRYIDLRYRNLGRGFRATVRVYGRNKAEHGGPVGRIWDSSGWTMIANASVDGRLDRDVVPVGKYAGAFDRVTLVVQDSDVYLADVTFVFGNGERFSPKVRMDFRDSSRTRVIDLPGNNRTIKQVELTYANKPGDRRRARVEVWARDSRGPAGGTPGRGPVWDNKGWVLVTSSTVTGKTDSDMIPVGRDEGKFRQLTLVVLDSDVEIDRFMVHFGNGQPLDIPIKQFFREGTRTRVIDLPGDKRVIKNIHLVYGNTRGGGRARVEVWGR